MNSPQQKLKEFAAHRPGFFSVLLSLTAVVFVTVPFFLWPQLPPLLVITAESETIQYRVTRPSVAELPLVNATIRNVTGKCAPLLEGKNDGQVSGLLKPPQNALVRYRWFPTAISIQVENSTKSATMLALSNGQTCVLPKLTSVLMPFPAPTSPAARPLPIVGPAEIGVEIHVPNLPKLNGRRVFGILYGGEIKIFGQTISGAIYPAQVGTIAIPAGGRLSSPKIASEVKDIKQSAAWYGMALIGKRALQISATTESNDLLFFRPGGTRDENTIAVGLFTRLLNDPSIALLSLAALVFVMAMQAITGWVGVWKAVPQQEDELLDEKAIVVVEQTQQVETQTRESETAEAKTAVKETTESRVDDVT